MSGMYGPDAPAGPHNTMGGYRIDLFSDDVLEHSQMGPEAFPKDIGPATRFPGVVFRNGRYEVRNTGEVFMPKHLTGDRSDPTWRGLPDPGTVIPKRSLLEQVQYNMRTAFQGVTRTIEGLGSGLGEISTAALDVAKVIVYVLLGWVGFKWLVKLLRVF